MQTIHFARWAFFDDKRRVFFVSNYDGSREAYMDDFINKVGVGPEPLFQQRARLSAHALADLRGARHEQKFKHYQRRHQLPTQVWYKAFPGLRWST